MKNCIHNHKARFISAGILGVLLFALVSCTKTIDFLQSTVVPAAKGSVEIKMDDNNNYVLNLKIVDLADASRLQPPRKSYVVWIQTNQGEIVKLGQLDSSTGFMSKQLKASLVTVSSFKPVKVFITAEDDSDVKSPNKLIIITTDEFSL